MNFQNMDCDGLGNPFKSAANANNPYANYASFFDEPTFSPPNAFTDQTRFEESYYQMYGEAAPTDNRPPFKYEYKGHPLVNHRVVRSIGIEAAMQEAFSAPIPREGVSPNIQFHKSREVPPFETFNFKVKAKINDTSSRSSMPAHKGYDMQATVAPAQQTVDPRAKINNTSSKSSMSSSNGRHQLQPALSVAIPTGSSRSQPSKIDDLSPLTDIDDLDSFEIKKVDARVKGKVKVVQPAYVSPVSKEAWMHKTCVRVEYESELDDDLSDGSDYTPENEKRRTKPSAKKSESSRKGNAYASSSQIGSSASSKRRVGGR